MDTNTIIKKLSEMIDFEEKQPDKYKFGAMLHHWRDPSDSITIDANALKVLLKYYKEKEGATK